MTIDTDINDLWLAFLHNILSLEVEDFLCTSEKSLDLKRPDCCSVCRGKFRPIENFKEYPHAFSASRESKIRPPRSFVLQFTGHPVCKYSFDRGRPTSPPGRIFSQGNRPTRASALNNCFRLSDAPLSLLAEPEPRLLTFRGLIWRLKTTGLTPRSAITPLFTANGDWGGSMPRLEIVPASFVVVLHRHR